MDQSFGQFVAFLLLFLAFWGAMLGWSVDIRKLRRAEEDLEEETKICKWWKASARRDVALAARNAKTVCEQHAALEAMKAAIKNLEAERDEIKRSRDAWTNEADKNLTELIRADAKLKKYEAMPRTSGKKLLENIEQAGIACATVFAQVMQAQEDTEARAKNS